MSDLVNLKDHANNFNQLAEAMGMGQDMEKKKSGSTLARLKISHAGIMGETNVKGKVKRVEVVDAGSYMLQLPHDDRKIFSTTASIRLFQQKFMHKKYVKLDDDKGMFIKTIMANDLKSDLIDNTGGVNCGKPSGWIEDYNSLPQETKDLLKSIKRVRVLFGEVTLHNPVDESGNEIDKAKEDFSATPFIWEVDNRDAFKILGSPITQMSKQNHILPQHDIDLETEERTIPTGAKYYLPTVKLNPKEIKLNEKDEKTLVNFNDWIKNYNDYIRDEHTKALKEKGDAESDKVVAEFVDVEEDKAA
tara:strand:+ start:17300 stop:18211 length:912 start_codon:yes stop_codon:yes gene_type:complete